MATKDSSVWRSTHAFDAARKKDCIIRIGIVRDVLPDPINGELGYMVEVFNNSNQIPVYCKRMEKFGGAFNYEEWTRQTYIVDKNSKSTGKYSTRAGDVVLIAYLGGDGREGIILGAVSHPGRAQQIGLSDGIAYESEFNGVNTSINDNGEYTITFKGIPTNINLLNQPSTGATIPAPTYNTTVGGSNFKFDQTGSWTLTDASQSNPQSIYVNKPGGTITVTAGPVTITMDKNANSITTQSNDVTINASNSITGMTSNYSMTASSTAKIKSPKIAIGTDGTELLDQLTKLITALGTLVIMSPIGPCAPFSTAPTWPQVMMVMTALEQIKGTL